MENSESAAVAFAGIIVTWFFAAHRPEEPRGGGGDEQQHDGKTGDDEFLKLLAGVARGKAAGIFRLKQRRAFAAGEFVELEFFQPLVFFETHLEPTDERDERAEAEEDRGGKARKRFHQRGDGDGGDEHQHGDD